MLFSCCKLREWVWTKTGKGDRLWGDTVGPIPFLDRPAPPHSLHNLIGPYQRPASFICQPVVLYLLVRICLASFACLCLDPMPACPCLHDPHVTISPCAPGPYVPVCLQRLPCRQPHHEDCIAQPVHRLHPVHFVFCIHPFTVPETPFEPQTVNLAVPFSSQITGPGPWLV